MIEEVDIDGDGRIDFEGQWILIFKFKVSILINFKLFSIEFVESLRAEHKNRKSSFD